MRCRSFSFFLFLPLSLCETYERSRVCIGSRIRCTSSLIRAVVYMFRHSAHAHGDKSTLRPFYWSTILSLSFSPLSSCPVTRLVSLLRSHSFAPSSTPLLYLPLTALARTYVKTHPRPDSMRSFPILVIRTRQNRSTLLVVAMV